MAPVVSIIIPTRRRRDYLEVTLASVAREATGRDVEVLVVEDDEPDPATAALAVRHGARHLAHGAPLGPNAARNTGIAAATAELICFLDDDVEVWPGWLAAVLDAAARNPGFDVVGGPIRARLEGSRLRACGREPLPITTLDLGAQETEAPFVWSANLAVRRAALERVGPFDPSLDIYGDEEDWQRRLHAIGGRVLYAPAAGVDHRRTGADARLAGLARAAWRRGRHSRRYDVRKGTSKPLADELRVLFGCIWHIARRRCGVGIVLTVLSAGRVAETLVPARLPPRALDPEYLSGRSGTLGRRALAIARARDVADLRRLAPARVALRRTSRRSPRRRVLALLFDRPTHTAMADAIAAELRRSHHDVELVRVVPEPGKGKWANVNAALERHPAAGSDWLVLLDDDVALPRHFLDDVLYLAERFDFRVAQPAHAQASHAAWEITRRRPGLVARRTNFVETGPVTLFRADVFDTLLPFPDLAMGWGLDAYWSALARERGWPIGVIDATPVRHLRPVAGDYPRDEAIAEAEAFLTGRAYVTRTEADEVVEAHTAW
ncbi:MAG TPA: glycosyltransferase [Solirubrobacteraceae bacterium]|nr:glycosyltransferase [Solirubrobacteraceae bacterium]